MARQAFVRVKGLEPLRLAARDPKSRLATNYNTPAFATANIVKKTVGTGFSQATCSVWP